MPRMLHAANRYRLFFRKKIRIYRRISGDTDSQIEHIYAKGTPAYEEMQLDYETNLLACCGGGKTDSIRKEDIYCEAPKGDTILPINPLNPDCEKNLPKMEKY